MLFSFQVLLIVIFISPLFIFPKDVHGFFGENIKNIVNKTVVSSQATFSNSSYTEPTNQFLTGETIYIKVETPSKGTEKRTFIILDSNKNTLTSLAPQIKTNGNSFIYEAQTTIDSEGMYYVRIEIKDESHNFSLEQNIQVENNPNIDKDGGLEQIKPNEEDAVLEENTFAASKSAEQIDIKAQTDSLTEGIFSYIQNIINRIREFFTK